jgi:uncharacterized protein Veg
LSTSLFRRRGCVVSIQGKIPATIGRNVTLKASNFNKSQHLSKNGLQQVQYQSVNHRQFQWISTMP